MDHQQNLEIPGTDSEVDAGSLATRILRYKYLGCRYLSTIRAKAGGHLHQGQFNGI